MTGMIQLPLPVLREPCLECVRYGRETQWACPVCDGSGWLPDTVRDAALRGEDLTVSQG